MCVIENGDYGTSGFQRSATRKARKEHRCYECRRFIAKGELYSDHVTLDEDRFFSAKHCSDCAKMADWLQEHCGGWIFGEVIEDINQHDNYAHHH